MVSRTDARPPCLDADVQYTGSTVSNVRSDLLLPSQRDQRSERIEEALVKAARTLTSRLDVDGVCEGTLDTVQQVFGATSSWILLSDAATRQLRTSARAALAARSSAT